MQYLEAKALGYGLVRRIGRTGLGKLSYHGRLSFCLFGSGAGRSCIAVEENWE